jgi:hypothetical protein
MLLAGTDAALRQVADELRNIRKSVDWTNVPKSLYAALRQSESVARSALGESLPTDFAYGGKYTTLEDEQ